MAQEWNVKNTNLICSALGRKSYGKNQDRCKVNQETQEQRYKTKQTKG